MFSEECKKAYLARTKANYRKKYGTDSPTSNPELNSKIQRKALANRKISGVYKFLDGGEIGYVGDYEKKFLEFMDKIMKINSEDLQEPGPDIIYQYKGENHLYIPDYYYIPYNLIIEIKRGGEKNPDIYEYKEKTVAKEEAVRRLNKYNYLRLTNNDFSQVMSIFGLLKYNFDEKSDEKIMRIYESIVYDETAMSGTIAAALAPSPVPSFADKNNYYIIQHMQNNVYDYSITKDPMQYTMFSIDPEKGYKVFKSDKGKIEKNYLTFKMKDSKKAKEVYDEIVNMCNNGKCAPCNDYVYYKYTNGNHILDESQLMFDNRLELIPNFYEGLQSMKEALYNYLTPSKLDILEEKVDELGGIIYGK